MRDTCKVSIPAISILQTGPDAQSSTVYRSLACQRLFFLYVEAPFSPLLCQELLRLLCSIITTNVHAKQSTHQAQIPY